jgi:cation-transporting ATPase 13A3/4/5
LVLRTELTPPIVFRYEAPVIDPDQLDTVSYENSALFLISSFQYIIVAVVFCVGPPYRKPIHSNILLLLTLVILAGFSTYTVFVHYGVVFNMLGLVDLPREFQLELFLLALANTGVSWIWEKVGNPKCVASHRNWRY